MDDVYEPTTMRVERHEEEREEQCACPTAESTIRNPYSLATHEYLIAAAIGALVPELLFYLFH